MTAVRTAHLVTAAAADRRGIAAFNVISLEHAEAIVGGAESAGAAVILQVSENAIRFHHGRLAPLARALHVIASDAAVPVALHLDHIESDDLLAEAPRFGFSSVMFDASTLPYGENVAATAAAVRFAHEHELWLESELGTVGGKDGQLLSPHDPGARTDPAQAADFVARTGADLLAVAIGSSHAMTARTAALDHDRLARIAEAVPVPLVLHGSSGVPDGELRHAVAGGIVKVNIGTALNTAYTSALRGALDREPSTVDPRRYTAPARDAMAATVAQYCTLLNSVSLLSLKEVHDAVDRAAGRR
jgi:fructose-bisphosphate aldolase class II